MLVYNLTAKPLSYRGVTLKPDGGSYDFRDMSFVPNRDMDLAKNRVIAFNALPQWWLDEKALRTMNVKKPEPVAHKDVPMVVEEKRPEPKSETKDFRKK